MKKEYLHLLIKQCLKDGIQSLDIENICRTDNIDSIDMDNISSIDLSKPSKAELFRSLLKEVEEMTPNEKVIRLNFDICLVLAELYMSKDEIEAYVAILEHALALDFSLFPNPNDSYESQSRIYLSLFHGYKLLGKDKEKMEVIEKAHKLVKLSIDNRRGLKPSYLYLDILIFRINEASTYEEIHSLYKEGERFFRKRFSDDFFEASLYQYYGKALLHLREEEYETDGLINVFKAMKIFEAINNDSSKTSLCSCHSDLMDHFFFKKIYKLSLKHAGEAYRIAKTIKNNPSLLLNALLDATLVAFDSKSKAKAMKYSNEFLDLVNTTVVEDCHYFNAYYLYTNIYLMQKKHHEAIKKMEMLLNKYSIKTDELNYDKYYSRLGLINYQLFLLHADIDPLEKTTLNYLNATIEAYKNINVLSPDDQGVLEQLKTMLTQKN